MLLKLRQNTQRRLHHWSTPWAGPFLLLQLSLVLAERVMSLSSVCPGTDPIVKPIPRSFFMLWQPWKHATPSRAFCCLQPTPQRLILNQYLQILEITQGEKYINVAEETKIMMFYIHFFFLPSLLPQNKILFSFLPSSPWSALSRAPHSWIISRFPIKP